jgi:hypothetical protein
MLARRLIIAAAICLIAADWPPVDPDEHYTQVAFTVAWAKRLRGFHTLTDLQRAAGAKGKIIGEGPGGFHWISDPQDGRRGYMRASVSENGDIGVSIVPVEQQTFGLSITLNNKGLFICPICNPPIDIEPPAGVDRSNRR